MNCSGRLRLCTSALLVLCVNSLAHAELRVLIPCATEGTTTWRYTTDKPDDNWTVLDFDDGKWREGKSGFGVTDHVTPPATIGTPWTTPDIWLRKTIDVVGPWQFTSAGMIVRHDEDVEVFVNGTLVFAERGFNTEWTAYDVSQELRATLKPGKNVVAVHVIQTSGGQYIDVGLVLDPQQKLIVSRQTDGPGRIASRPRCPLVGREGLGMVRRSGTDRRLQLPAANGRQHDRNVAAGDVRPEDDR